MIKIVDKTWGNEFIIVNKDYCGKILHLEEGKHCSVHYHEQKDETFYIIEGKVYMEYCRNYGSVKTWNEIRAKNILKKGDIYHVPPNTLHRFTGIQNSKILEISTHHEEKDSIRLEPSGKTNICFIDIDGFLCTDKKGVYHKVKPIQKNIDLVNKKFEDGELIIIWTARGTTTGIDWEKLTTKQLKQWGVKYHDLRFNKPYYDEIWDDKAKELS